MTVTPRAERPYDHAAVIWEDPDTGRVECRVCGDPVVQVTGRDIRHVGEHAPHEVPATDPAVYAAALDTAQTALTNLPPYADDADRARVIISTLWTRGMLRSRPGAPGRVLNRAS